MSMTAQERKVAGWLAGLVSFVVLVTAAKAATETWLVPQREMYARDSAQAIRNYRDSVFQQKVGRYIDYQNCKERYGVSSCLKADR